VAVPGAVGVVADRLVVWDGERLVDGERAPARTMELGEGLPEPVLRIANVWAGARGLAARPLATDGPGATAVLVLHGFSRYAAGHPCRVARDGWSATAESTGPLPLRDGHGSIERWLAAEDGEVVVASAPGRVHVALRSIDEPRGDPAAWAVSWSSLFDDALALPQGCVSLRERSAAGSPLTRDPVIAKAHDTDAIGPWTALAAATAALFALAAAWLGLSSARERTVAVS
jgi:hypothetical protein